MARVSAACALWAFSILLLWCCCRCIHSFTVLLVPCSKQELFYSCDFWQHESSLSLSSLLSPTCIDKADQQLSHFSWKLYDSSFITFDIVLHCNATEISCLQCPRCYFAGVMSSMSFYFCHHFFLELLLLSMTQEVATKNHKHCWNHVELKLRASHNRCHYHQCPLLTLFTSLLWRPELLLPNRCALSITSYWW